MFVQPTEVSLRWGEVPCVQQNEPITAYVVRYYATHSNDRNVQRRSSGIKKIAYAQVLQVPVQATSFMLK